MRGFAWFPLSLFSYQTTSRLGTQQEWFASITHARDNKIRYFRYLIPLPKRRTGSSVKFPDNLLTTRRCADVPYDYREAACYLLATG